MFQSNVRLPPRQKKSWKKSFPATHPLSDLPVARLRALRESRSRRKNRGLRAKRHPDSPPPQGSLPVPSEQPVPPDRAQSSAADRATAQARQDSEARRRATYLPLPEKTIVRNRAAPHGPTFPATASARAVPGSPMLRVATGLRLLPRPFAALFH